MYLIEASICPKMLRTGQAVLPFKPNSAYSIGLPSSSSIQMVVTGRWGHNCNTRG